MMRVVMFSLTVLALTACKPQKPWSPYDASGTPNSADVPKTSNSVDDQFNANIGDVEQAVYVNGVIAAESGGPNVVVSEARDRNKRLLKSDVILKEPYPQSLWADYDIKCTRNFMSAPVILRAKIMVNDKVAGSFSEVLGTQASKTKVTAKVDLLKPFEGNIPETFLAKIDGDLYLMPNGTDENKVNPETATADIHSKAVYSTLIRVTLQKPGTEIPEAPPSAAAEPTDPTTGDAGVTAAEMFKKVRELDESQDHEHGEGQEHDHAHEAAPPAQPAPPTSE
ncbi:MAG: hypothetical protein IT366_19940 [Candidatus Hydrogenedentes bacterium]|nr:hypothetical protein [Candidatus Hydrogenedentota bacterium]